MLQEAILQNPHHHFHSDASGNWGAGAVWLPHWFQFQWNAAFQQEGITQKELLPVVLACMVWGPMWSNSVVLVSCDNQAVVAILNSGYSKDPVVMHLLRCLFFILARFTIFLRATHIPGVLNCCADALSRNNLSLFLSKAPEANPLPTSSYSASTNQPSGGAAAGLDLSLLDPIVQDLFASGLALSTRKTYRTGGARYEGFCRKYGLSPYPVV